MRDADLAIQRATLEATRQARIAKAAADMASNVDWQGGGRAEGRD